MTLYQTESDVYLVRPNETKNKQLNHFQECKPQAVHYVNSVKRDVKLSSELPPSTRFLNDIKMFEMIA